MLTLLQPAVIVAQGKQVREFLCNRRLPSNAKLVEGVHHANRKSTEVKERLLSGVCDAIHSEYLIFLEDDYKAKVLLYRWRP